MRNELLRKILGYAGIALSAYAVGVTFGLALTALSLGMFIYFLWILLAALLALVGFVKVIYPAIDKFIIGSTDGVSNLVPKDLFDKVKARFSAA